MAFLRARFALLAALLVAASAFTTACSNQAEGERCNLNNNDDDCQDGLFCKSSAELGGNADICCPDGPSEIAACVPGGGGTSTTAASTGAASTVTSASSGGTGGAGGDGQGGAGQGGATTGSQGGAGGQGVGGQGGAGG